MQNTYIYDVLQKILLLFFKTNMQVFISQS